jgi:polysaccharide lyase-like protein
VSGAGLVLTIALLAALSLNQSCTTRDAGVALPQGDTVFVEDFESGTLAAWSDGVNPTLQRVVTDSSVAQSGSRYLDVTYAVGGDGGWLTRFFMPGYDSLYVSYYVYFPASWRGGTKLLGLYGSRTDNQWSGFGKAGVCPTGTDFFIAMVVTEATGDPGDARFYTYYPAMAREGDGVTCWGRYGDGTETYVPPLTLSPGVWHHVEFWVKLNAPGQSDASQILWIDGVQRAMWSGFSFRSGAELRLNAVQLSFNRGVAGGPVEQHLYVDHLVATTVRPAR